MAIYELIEERASKGIVKDYFSGVNTLKEYNEVPYMYKTLMDMVEIDPVLFRACDLTTSLVTYKSFDFIGKDQRQIEKARKVFNHDLDFDKVIKNILWQLIVYGDAYLELRWNESKTRIMELHPLETTEMKIKYTKNAEIQYYIQKVVAKKEEDKRFEVDEVIHFRLYWIGSQVYSKCPFKSIAKTFATNVYANDYLTSIFRNLPPKIIYFLKNANDKQRKLFVENLIRAKTNPNMDIIAQGEAFDSKLAEPSFDDGLVNVMKLLEKRVLMITGVPPHWVGIIDGTNRGIGENVIIPYETKIKGLQHEIESQVNRELMDKLGFGSLKFKWNAISLMNQKEIIANAGQLNALGFDSKTIIEYLRNHGLNLRAGALIEKPPESDGAPQIQNETAPSRQREDKNVDKIGNKLDKKGVSAEGKEKLDKKKVM